MTELPCDTNTEALLGFLLRTYGPAVPGTMPDCSTLPTLKGPSFAGVHQCRKVHQYGRSHSGPPGAEHHLFHLALSHLVASLCMCTL